jgi:hypothetical protein
MVFNFDSFIDEFLSSQHFLLVPSETKEHAAALLGSFSDACRERSGCSPDTFSIVDLESVLFGTMARLDAPLAVRRAAPDLLRVFFEFLAQSGRFPPARAWVALMPTVGKRYQEKIRDDGSVKGETFKKKYTDVNRNDPCPCGSGKKFKKCCMKLIA